MNYVLDISGHNGAVDFEKVKAAGISLRLCKERGEENEKDMFET